LDEDAEGDDTRLKRCAVISCQGKSGMEHGGVPTPHDTNEQPFQGIPFGHACHTSQYVRQGLAALRPAQPQTLDCSQALGGQSSGRGLHGFMGTPTHLGPEREGRRILSQTRVRERAKRSHEVDGFQSHDYRGCVNAKLLSYNLS
jgi:hypothetical protein